MSRGLRSIKRGVHGPHLYLRIEAWSSTIIHLSNSDLVEEPDVRGPRPNICVLANTGVEKRTFVKVRAWVPGSKGTPSGGYKRVSKPNKENTTAD